MRANLKAARESKGLNKKELAALTGITDSYYITLEAGRFKGSVEIWLKLSEVLEKPIAQLLEIAEGSVCNAGQLRALRQAKGMTQKQVAEALNIPESTYCGIEKGKSKGTMAQWKQISEYFGTPVTYASNKNYGREPKATNPPKQAAKRTLKNK